jgi:hypothetical protein
MSKPINISMLSQLPTPNSPLIPAKFRRNQDGTSKLSNIQTHQAPMNFNLPILMNNIQSLASRWARLKSWAWLFLAFNLSLLTFNSCGLDIEDPTPPSAPIWVQKSLPEEWPERGIDAHEYGGIYLEWDANPANEQVETYNIYRALFVELLDSLGDFGLIMALESDAEVNVEYIDRSSELNIRYYYYLRAVDVAGNQSIPSDTLSYLLFVPVYSESLKPNGDASPLGLDRKLTWDYDYHVAMENYVVRILRAENDELIYSREFTPNYTGASEYFILPDSISFFTETMYEWRIDISAQYVNGIETAGSESSWAMFLYEGD